MLKGNHIRLRALEPEDIDFLFRLENDTSLWHVSDNKIPLSKDVLSRYLENAHQDLLEAGQYRFVIDLDRKAIGFLDLFEYDAIHKRAGVGIAIAEAKHRGKGYAKEALKIVQQYAIEVWKLHQLFANIDVTNISSQQLFVGVGFREIGVLKDWKSSQNGFQDVKMYQWLAN